MRIRADRPSDGPDGPVPVMDGNRDRGKPFDFSPPTSPCVRVRTRRFGWLSGRSGREECNEAERLEELPGKSFVKSRAFGQTPRAVA